MIYYFAGDIRAKIDFLQYSLTCLSVAFKLHFQHKQLKISCNIESVRERAQFVGLRQ